MKTIDDLTRMRILKELLDSFYDATIALRRLGYDKLRDEADSLILDTKAEYMKIEADDIILKSVLDNLEELTRIDLSEMHNLAVYVIPNDDDDECDDRVGYYLVDTNAETLKGLDNEFEFCDVDDNTITVYRKQPGILY